jgi:hypothetical protein
MIEVKGYKIGNNGDTSVGINPSWWEITGTFFFEDEQEKNEFEKSLLDTFNLVCDPIFIYTFEELERKATQCKEK